MPGRERVMEVLDYDPDTGIFRWKVRLSNSIHVGDIAGSPDGEGYLMIRLDNRYYKAHRLAWLYVHGAWPDDQIDHINTDPADNRIANLRQATQLLNKQNSRRSHRDSASRYLGVSWDRARSKWLAQICVNGQRKNLGRFDTEEAAYAAYLAAKAAIHPFSTLKDT
jgi:HNH endonuclease/AP2 domain